MRTTHLSRSPNSSNPDKRWAKQPARDTTRSPHVQNPFPPHPERKFDFLLRKNNADTGRHGGPEGRSENEETAGNSAPAFEIVSQKFTWKDRA